VILGQELCGDAWEFSWQFAGKSVLNCLQAFHLTRVDAVSSLAAAAAESSN